MCNLPDFGVRVGYENCQGLVRRLKIVVLQVSAQYAQAIANLEWRSPYILCNNVNYTSKWLSHNINAENHYEVVYELVLI